MKSTVAIACLLVSLAQAAQGWSLQHDYSAPHFFDGFNFFSKADPTKGFVKYVDQKTATARGLAYTHGDKVVMRADNSSVVSDGRPSVRIASKERYNGGLFIFDFSHMPFGCGTWPAYWLIGPHLPDTGEMDLLEGVNNRTSNTITLHTADSCTMDNVKRNQKGTILHTDCSIGSANRGCSVQDSTKGAYGAAFNRQQGGVIATKWTAKQGMQQWFFPRHKVPKDISSGKPDPHGWGIPVADFPFTKCSASHFSDMAITINLDFCGSWAGAVYDTSGCPSDCETYVGQHPEAFDQAYWSINSLKVYQP